ncbi:MAG: hypothetical protein IKH78_05370 [Ruminococcus sp.]|nr:hypothetical protein [Ruminococcus sp.]
MKRIIALLSAISMIGCCFSCSNKKESEPDVSGIQTESKSEDSEIRTKNDVSDGAVHEPVGIADVQPFREYGKEDLRTINVVKNIVDKKPPLTMHHKVISQVDFGRRISVCKDMQYRERYRISGTAFSDAEDYERDIRAWEQSCTEPYKGEITDIFIDGVTIYAAVNFDFLCPGGCHEFSIFRIDDSTDEVKEIYRYSDPENSLSVTQLYEVGGGVCAVTREMGICVLDEEKGELIPIPGSRKDFRNEYFNQRIIENSAGRLIVEYAEKRLEPVDSDYVPESDETVYTADNGEKFVHTGDDCTMKEYDLETKQWRELYSAFKPCYVDISGTKEYPQLCGELFVWKEKDSSGEYDVITDRYRISTGLTECKVIYASEDKLVVTLGDYGSNGFVLNVYDLKKGEHYVYNYALLGSVCMVFGDGIVITSGLFSSAYYVKPELGIAFPFGQIEIDGDVFTKDSYRVADNSISYIIGYAPKGAPEYGVGDMNYSWLTDLLVWYTKENENV